MSAAPIEPRWPRLLGLAVHEFRTPITVVAGYIRMLLKERAGAITDQQRKLLEEAEKSCGRLSALVSEMSELSALESGKSVVEPRPVDLAALLNDVVESLPELIDREITVRVELVSGLRVSGDATRLRMAFTAVLTALRRELITSDVLLVRMAAGNSPSGTARIGIADPGKIDEVFAADPGSLPPFDEWRGGNGLSLAIARRVFGQHSGSLLAPPGDEKAGAVIILPME